ncbi:MAG TPA: hypothetical protein VEC19_12645 [Usitatibacter sp.]|nr:hypothetical protein [Usitatibacter sp.]
MKPHISGSIVLATLSACASSPPAEPYWRHMGSASATEFPIDNQGCAARASRMAPTGRADLLTSGATVPNNRIDRPPERWVSSVADRAYMDCMRERGWVAARR